MEKGKGKGTSPKSFSKMITKYILRLNMSFIMIGVLSLAIASIVTFSMGIAHFILFIMKDIQWHHFHIPHNFDAVICEMLEINLIAVILFICAIGLYLLFWKDICVPEWLIVTNINQLKEKLVGILITVMGVTFLEHILEWNDPQGTILFGGAISLVVFSLVFYIKVLVSGEAEKKNEHH